MGALPEKLEHPPLTEAVFELRFTGAKEGAGDLIPGLMYGHLGPMFTDVEQLPFGRVPKELLKASPELTYQPKVRLVGNGVILQIGDRVAAFSKIAPYDGWPSFQARCLDVLGALSKTALTGTIERFSMKCINVIEHTDHPLAALNAELRLGHQSFADRGIRLRVEIDDVPFVSIVEIAAPVSFERADKTTTGMLVTIDTLRQIDTAEFWADPAAQLERAHVIMKRIFFDLLAPKTLEGFGPSWGSK